MRTAAVCPLAGITDAPEPLQDWVRTRSGHGAMVQVPKGHCWIEGDNTTMSADSNRFGAVPLGLVDARVLCVVWPPNRVGVVARRPVPERVMTREEQLAGRIEWKEKEDESSREGG